MMMALLLLAGLHGTALAKDGKQGNKGAKISFRETEHDFGTIAEDDGAVSHTFTFKNEGKVPIVVQSVSTSCGCTASDWTKEPVLPGKEGKITARFNPLGRPHQFTKSLTVRSNGDPASVILFIRGNVTPHVKTPSEIYFYRIGAFGTKGSYHSMDKITDKGKHATELEVHNFSEKKELISLVDYPPYMSVKPETLKVRGGETGSFKIIIDGEKVPSYDYQSCKVTVKHGETSRALHYAFTLLPDFSHIKDKDKAAKAYFPHRNVDLGQRKKGKTIKYDFVVKNIGKAPLKILRAKTSCGCMLVDLDEKEIRPGGETTLHMVFNTEGYAGRTNKTIKLILNDPSQPMVTLGVTVVLE